MSQQQKKFLPVLTAIEAQTGVRPHPSTPWRWATKGQGGVVLQTWMVGGRRMTTVEAVAEFIEARTQAASPQSTVSKVREALNRELGIQS